MDRPPSQGGTMPVETPGDKKSLPEGLWSKCQKCETILYNKELEENLWVCPKCNYHFRLNATRRLQLLLDAGSTKELFGNLTLADATRYTSMGGYAEKLKSTQKKLKSQDAAV